MLLPSSDAMHDISTSAGGYGSSFEIAMRLEVLRTWLCSRRTGEFSGAATILPSSLPSRWPSAVGPIGAMPMSILSVPYALGSSYKRADSRRLRGISPRPDC